MKVRKLKASRLILALILVFIALFMALNYKKIGYALYPTKFSEYVEKYSSEYGVDKYLVYSIIKTESKFHTRAISSKKAKGLMQITDKTAAWGRQELGLGDADIYDPETNIRIGIWYLGKLQKEFRGEYKLVIAAYNGGSGNVRKWLTTRDYSKDGKNLAKIPFNETSKYSQKVLDNYEKYKYLYE